MKISLAIVASSVSIRFAVTGNLTPAMPDEVAA